MAYWIWMQYSWGLFHQFLQNLGFEFKKYFHSYDYVENLQHVNRQWCLFESADSLKAQSLAPGYTQSSPLHATVEVVLLPIRFSSGQSRFRVSECHLISPDVHFFFNLWKDGNPQQKEGGSAAAADIDIAFGARLLVCLVAADSPVQPTRGRQGGFDHAVEVLWAMGVGSWGEEVEKRRGFGERGRAGGQASEFQLLAIRKVATLCRNGVFPWPLLYGPFPSRDASAPSLHAMGKRAWLQSHCSFVVV